MIRAARDQDIPTLRAIERDAGRVFTTLGMAEIAEDEPPSAGTLRRYVEQQQAWVHTADGRPVAYVLVDIVDGCAHIEQVSVRSAHAGRRVGAGLIEHVDAWAARGGAAALTLTTFTDVPWNGPYYERCGFRRLSDAEVTPGLRELRRAEAEHGPRPLAPCVHAARTAGRPAPR